MLGACGSERGWRAADVLWSEGHAHISVARVNVGSVWDTEACLYITWGVGTGLERQHSHHIK